MLSQFLERTSSELDRLSGLVKESSAKGRFSEAKKHADRIAEILAWGAQIEQIESELNKLPRHVERARMAPVPVSAPPGPAPGVALAQAVIAPGPAPALQPEPQPAKRPPKLVEQETSEAERLKARRKRFQDKVKAFLDETRKAPEDPSWNPEREARIKSLILKGRALEAEAADLKDSARSLIRDEILIIGQWWDQMAEVREFFGMNSTRTHTSDVWEEAALGYELLATSLPAVAWLESGEAVNETQRLNIMEMAAAAESYLARVFDDRGMMVWDSQQKDVHSRLERMDPTPQVTKWWRRNENPPSLEELHRRAAPLQAELEGAKKAKVKAEQSGAALQEMEEWLAAMDGKVFDEEEMCRRVEDVLDKGVPPSSKPLRVMLAGYSHLIKQSTNKEVIKLDQYLRKDALEALAKGQISVDGEDEEDAEAQAKLDALLPITKGKTVMFVGGSKRQGWRKNEYIKALQIEDLMWPDAEEWTKVEDLIGQAQKADIVCLLIRFSRHSYKSVLDESKKMGKLTVTLPRGLGVNTVIHEMWTQLAGGADSSGSAIPAAAAAGGE